MPQNRLPEVAGFQVFLSGRVWVFGDITAFVGANLLQSAFTNACPAMTIFRKLGLRDAGAPASLGGRGR